jgi:cobaltochelatase CobS
MYQDRLNTLGVRHLWRLANHVGMRGDFARILNPKSVGIERIAAHLTAGNYTVDGLEQAIAATTAAGEKVAEAVATATDPVASALEALQTALAGKAAAAAGLDEAAVTALVVDLLDKRNARHLNVTVADHTTEVEGRAHSMFERVLRIVNTRASGRRLHVWLTGPSGSGKSYLAAQVAKASGLPFYCTGAVSDKYSLIGFINAGDNGERNLMTEFRKAFEFGGVFAWDEIDASNPAALCAFNDALSNGRCAFPDRTVEQHADFVAMASANTWGNGATAEYVGRTRIDAATLNRFVRVAIDYDETLERDLAGAHREWALFVQAVRRSVATNGLKVLITPRHTIQGAALLEAGMSREDVEAMTVFAGLDAATIDRIRLGA